MNGRRESDGITEWTEMGDNLGRIKRIEEEIPNNHLNPFNPVAIPSFRYSVSFSPAVHLENWGIWLCFPDARPRQIPLHRGHCRRADRGVALVGPRHGVARAAAGRHLLPKGRPARLFSGRDLHLAEQRPVAAGVVLAALNPGNWKKLR